MVMWHVFTVVCGSQQQIQMKPIDSEWSSIQLLRCLLMRRCKIRLKSGKRLNNSQAMITRVFYKTFQILGWRKVHSVCCHQNGWTMPPPSGHIYHVPTSTVTLLNLHVMYFWCWHLTTTTFVLRSEYFFAKPVLKWLLPYYTITGWLPHFPDDTFTVLLMF